MEGIVIINNTEIVIIDIPMNRIFVNDLEFFGKDGSARKWVRKREREKR